MKVITIHFQDKIANSLELMVHSSQFERFTVRAIEEKLQALYQDIVLKAQNDQERIEELKGWNLFEEFSLRNCSSETLIKYIVEKENVEDRFGEVIIVNLPNTSPAYGHQKLGLILGKANSKDSNSPFIVAPCINKIENTYIFDMPATLGLCSSEYSYTKDVKILLDQIKVIEAKNLGLKVSNLDEKEIKLIIEKLNAYCFLLQHFNPMINSFDEHRMMMPDPMFKLLIDNWTIDIASRRFYKA